MLYREQWICSGMRLMARTRNLKPGFFHNEYLVELPPETRLLFAGLPCIADREGRLDDRPKKIKMMLFPADVYNIDAMLDDLQDAGFILRYIAIGNKYIQIINFLRHQSPHHAETESVIPQPESETSPRQARDKPASSRPLTLNPSSLTLNPCTSNFDAWWKAYPNKVGKKPAAAIWKRIKPDSDLLIADVERRLQMDHKWREGFIPNPTTYLNQERWNDEISRRAIQPVQTLSTPQSRNREAIENHRRQNHGEAMVLDA